MPTFVALSCLQGRTQADAFEALWPLGVDGVQLTPGNLPSPGFRDQIAAYQGATRFHHGFSWDAYRRPIYERGLLLSPVGAGPWSVHPPRAGEATWDTWAPLALMAPVLFEVMYPGYLLGSGDEVEAAMTLGLALAVDTSHLHIQHRQGVLSERCMRRLLDYERVAEVHISSNDGRADQHRPLTSDSFLLEWARERGACGTPVVYESYLHRLSADERRAQLELARRA